jgi:hypothetical protein
MDPKKWPKELSDLGVLYEPNPSGEWEVFDAQRPPEIQQYNVIQYVVQDERGNLLSNTMCYMTVPGEKPAQKPTEGPESPDMNGKTRHMIGHSFIEKTDQGWGGGVHSSYVVNPAKSETVTGMGLIVPKGMSRNQAQHTSFELTFRRRKPAVHNIIQTTAQIEG